MKSAPLMDQDAATSLYLDCSPQIGSLLKMTSEAVEKVIIMLNSALEKPIEGLSAETKVLEIAGFDSLTMERLAGELQNELGEEVNPLAFAQVETISDLAKLIDKPRSGR